MATEYKIPLQFQAGTYSLGELPQDAADVLTLTLGDYDILSYHTPKDGAEVRIYSSVGFMITEQMIRDGLSATYHDDGMLKYVELTQGDHVRLVYIGYRDDEDAKAEILDFAEQSAEIISDELLSSSKKAARVFIEYYRDENIDFAAKIADEAEVQAVIDSLGERADQPDFAAYAVNNSGNYSNENRIECDRHTLNIMLLCAPRGIGNELMDLAIDTMIAGIKARVTDQLDKTDDFQFIAEEYD